MQEQLRIGLIFMAIVAGGCAGSNGADPEADALWTTREAESITSGRGLRARARN